MQCLTVLNIKLVYIEVCCVGLALKTEVGFGRQELPR